MIHWFQSNLMLIGVLWADFHDFLIWGVVGLMALLGHKRNKKHKLNIQSVEDTVREFKLVLEELESHEERIQALEKFESKLKHL